MRLAALTFDYGGTLDGPGSHWLDRFGRLYREAGLDLEFDRVKAAFYQADAAAYEEPRVAELDLADLMRFHVETQLRWLGISGARLCDDLAQRFVRDAEIALRASRAVLEALSVRYRLGVVSNFYGNVERLLADAGFAPLLRCVIDSNRVGVCKPDPAIFQLAARRLGVPVGTVLHTGDSYERDVLGAKAAGLHAAWLVRGDPGRRGADADLCVASLEELAARLRSTPEGERS